jgi:hemolysin activation/secretion protein
LLLTALFALVGRVHADPAASENHFDVHEYRVLGNTVLPNRDIETVLYPLLGDHKTLADVEIARAALEKTYHDRGFGTVFVDIPEQEVSEKIVRLKVTEGRLHEVRISGARYFSERKIPQFAGFATATLGGQPANGGSVRRPDSEGGPGSRYRRFGIECK